MSAKRFSSRGVMIVLLAMSLVGGGCATTSSQASKPHKPQMITADGVEEVGASRVEGTFANGMKLSDNWANTLTVMGPVIQFLGEFLACH
jgi:hypothetical protein